MRRGEFDPSTANLPNADAEDMTGGLSRALATPRVLVHDRGRVRRPIWRARLRTAPG